MKFSWFPGHMKKALRQINEHLSLIDAVIFILDARIPKSSFNPELEKIIGKKKALYVMNKTDLASPAVTAAWLKKFKNNDMNVAAVSSKKTQNFKELIKILENIREEVYETKTKKNRTDKTLRLMVMGIPNSGKSTIINRLAGKNVVMTGKKAGLTKGLQWLSISRDIEIMDAPGIFYPKLETEEAAWHLAAVGAAKETVFPADELAFHILKFLSERNCGFCVDIPTNNPEEALHFAGLKKNFIKAKGAVDYERTAAYIITNFREGNFGAFSLEFPQKEE